MFNKKRLFVAGAFLIALLFMTMYAGGSGEQGTTAMRIVKFIDGYNNAEISTQNVEVGKEAIVPDSPTHRNNLFIGWYNDETEITSFKNITENLTVISRYVDDINNNGIADSEEESYTVTFFDTIANENISVVDILTGMDATAPAVPSHDGYTFTGWSRGFTNVASDLTVNARYRTTEELESDVVNTYTVRFLVGDEEISTQTIEEGASATAPDVREIDKKVFTGWDTSFDEVKNDLTVKAVYAADINENGLDDEDETRYTVTFESSTGGTLTGTTEFTNLLIKLSLEDNGVTIPEPIEEDGYEFNGWNVELTSETKVAGNTTYTANFKDIEKPRVEIKNVNEYNPKSFDIWAVDLESGLRRMDYSLFTNDNTLYLGGGGQWIEGIVDIFELNNITEYYSLEEEKYLLKDLPKGEYTLRATVSDNFGNTDHAANYDFEVDKTAPKFNFATGYHNDDDIQIIITEKNFSQVKIYNQDINKTIIEKNLAFTFTEEATYRLTAKDKADNEATIWVAIDKTNPEIYNNDELIINDSHYKEDVVLTIKDKFLLTANINGQVERSLIRSDFEVGENKENFSYSEILTESGNYEVIAKDKFGNTTTINFVIDKTDPDVTIETPEVSSYIADKFIISGTATDDRPGLSEVTVHLRKVKENGDLDSFLTTNTVLVEDSKWSLELNSKDYDDGEYGVTVIANDVATNKKEVHLKSFTIDNIAPGLTLLGNNQGTPAQSHARQIKVTDVNLEISSLKYIWTTERLDDDDAGAEIVAATEEKGINFVSEETITTPSESGNYYLAAIAYDKAGNYSVLTTWAYYVDKTDPEVTNVTYSPEELTNQDVLVTLEFSEEVKPIIGWTQDKSDNTIWTKTYSQNGEETVNFEDLAENTGLPTEIKVNHIDKIGPTAVISKSSVNDKGNVVATLEASEPIQDIDGWTRKNGSANTFTQEFTQDVDYIVEFKDLVGNSGEKHLVIDNINPKYTNINYYQIGGLHYATITFDQLVTPPGPWWFRALDSERVRYDGVRHGNKWYTSSFTSYELTFKNRYGKTVTVPINSALNQSNASIETESNSILSTGEGNINFPPAQSRSFSRENFSETDSVVDDQNQISAGETETTIEEETPVTDEETSTNDFSTIPEEKTLFDEIIEEADIKSDEPEVIETTEENI